MPSAVWESFEKTNDGTKVVCLLCDKHLKYRSSTSSMRLHLQNVHGLKLKRSFSETNSECDDDASSESNAEKNGSSSSSATSVSELRSRPVTDISAQSGPSGESSQRVLVSQGPSAPICKKPRRFVSHERREAISQAIANMTAIDMLPLSFCENEGFKKLMEVVEPAYKVPTRHTIEKRVEIMGRDLQAIVVADLKEAEAITFASDGWTSLAVVPYETVTGHYINKKWEAICVTLSTESMEESHTGENIAERIYSVAADLNIEDKVMAVVHDNAANMEVAARILEINYGIENHIRCAAHTLQLCINSGLEKFESILGKASKLVGHFKHSHKATGALHNMQLQLDLPKERLIQNCRTRWNSTYYMTCRLLKHRTAVTAVLSYRTITVAKDMLQLEIPEASWCIIEQISLALYPLEIVTTLLCADKKATLSMVRPIMHSLLVNHLRPGITDTQLISEFKETVAGNIRRRFELEVEITVPKYVHPAQLASLLDPRYKKLDCEPSDSTKQSIREALREQYDQLKIQRGSRGVTEEPQVQSPAKPSNALDFIFNRQVDKDDELDAYLVTSQADMHTDPLTCWRIHEQQYPVLAQLAKKYLAIPATSASAERVFSCAGNIVTAKRSCLSPDHVNLLIYIHQNKHLI